jgi:flagellar protein FliL
MAKDAKPAEEGADGAPKKSKKLLIIIIAFFLLLLIGGGGAAYLLMSGGHDELEEDEAAEENVKPNKKANKKKEKSAPPVFVNLEPFTVNLVPEVGDQYLQVALSVELEDPTAQESLTVLMPRIRNNVTLLLSSRKASELLPKEGKEKLASEIMQEINDAINPPTTNKQGVKQHSEGPIVSVLFTSFIIQ